MYQSDFPIFANNATGKNPLSYLDSAASSQKPRHVLEGTQNYIAESYSNIHRGRYDLSEKSEMLFEESKRKCATYLGCKFSEIIYTYNATHASNLLAQSLVASQVVTAGSKVLVGVRDHHATIVPRQLLAKQYDFAVEFIHLRDDHSIDRNDFEDRYDENVSAVVCSMVSNVTGRIYPMKELRLKLRDDTFFAIDGSQAIPHFAVDVHDLGCDAFFFTAHKVMAYSGLGIMYLKKDWIRSLTPMMGGGGVIEEVSETGCTLARTSEKFEAGTPNVIGAVSLLKAFEYIESIGGYEAMQRYEDELVEYTIKQFKELGDQVVVFAPLDANERIGVFSFVVPGKNSIDLSDYMAARNIAIRCGGHCAHPLLESIGQKALCRMSLYLYNNKSDIDRFFATLHDFINET